MFHSAKYAWFVDKKSCILQIVQTSQLNYTSSMVVVQNVVLNTSDEKKERQELKRNYITFINFIIKFIYN